MAIEIIEDGDLRLAWPDGCEPISCRTQETAACAGKRSTAKGFSTCRTLAGPRRSRRRPSRRPARRPARRRGPQACCTRCAADGIRGSHRKAKKLPADVSLPHERSILRVLHRQMIRRDRQGISPSWY